MENLSLNLMYETFKFYPPGVAQAACLSKELRERLTGHVDIFHRALEEMFGNLNYRTLTFDQCIQEVHF
jgi:hypothetical protein